MSLFFRGAAEQRAITTDDVPWVEGGTYPPGAPEQALRLIPLYAAVASIADSIATLPVHAFTRAGNGVRRPAANPPGIVTAPGVVGTRVDWLVQAISSLLLRGNAYGLVLDTDANLWPRKVHWLNPANVHVDETTPTSPAYFHNGRLIPSEMVVHIPAFVLPGSIVGLNPVALFRRQIQKGLAAEEYANDFFERGIMPPGVLKNTAKVLTTTESEIAKRRFKASVAGRDIFVTGSDWTWDALTLPADDAAFLETIKATATQIAALYRLAPEDIGGETGSSMTYQTLEMNEIKRSQRALLPWTARLEAAWDRLIPDPTYVRFNLDAVARADLKTRTQSHEIALRSGLETIDEARAMEERPPLTDDQVADWQKHYRRTTAGPGSTGSTDTNREE